MFCFIIFGCRGVDVTVPNSQGINPLMFATKQNRVENMRLLMECKVPVGNDDDSDEDDDDENEKNKERGDKNDEEVPMKSTINIDGKDKATLTALHHAAKRGFTVRFPTVHSQLFYFCF